MGPFLSGWREMSRNSFTQKVYMSYQRRIVDLLQVLVSQGLTKCSAFLLKHRLVGGRSSTN